MTTSSPKRVPLSKGFVALVSPEDFDRIARFKWRVTAPNGTGKRYAVRTEHIGNRKYRQVLMHREVMGLGPGDKRQVDHRRCEETLNNTRRNLRIATHQQNHFNISKHRDNSTGFKGVSREKRRFAARIKVAGKQLYLGARDTPQEAAVLYQQAAEKHFGEFARAN